MDIVFRKIRPEESLNYRNLRLDCLKNYPENFGSDYEVEKQKDKLFLQHFIENPISENFVVGGFNGNRLIAISGFERFSLTKTKHRGRIIQVYVSREYQGNNLGHGIVRATLDEAFKIEGLEQIEIGVISNNLVAARIYENLGFVEFCFQKNYLKTDGIYYHHIMMNLNRMDYLPSKS